MKIKNQQWHNEYHISCLIADRFDPFFCIKLLYYTLLATPLESLRRLSMKKDNKALLLSVPSFFKFQKKCCNTIQYSTTKLIELQKYFKNRNLNRIFIGNVSFNFKAMEDTLQYLFSITSTEM